MKKNLLKMQVTDCDFTKIRVGIVASSYNQKLSQSLLFGCKKGLRSQGVLNKRITLLWAPGAFEIPFMCRKLMLLKKFDILIALGVIIKGETDHYEYVCKGTVEGLISLNLLGEIPIIFEVLMVHNFEHALARCSRVDMHNNKGYEAALAAFNMIEALDRIRYNALV